MSSEASFQPHKLTYKEEHSLPDRLITGPWQKLETILFGVGKRPELIGAEERKFEGIKITGEAFFVDGVVRALELMRNKAPGFYQIVSTRVKRISQAEIEGTTVVDVTKGEILGGSSLIRNRKYSEVDETDIYPAGVIAHEAKHIDLYKRRLPSKGEGAEKVCVKFQVFALTEMGASERTIQRTDWARLALETPWLRKRPEVRWFEGKRE